MCREARNLQARRSQTGRQAGWVGKHIVWAAQEGEGRGQPCAAELGVQMSAAAAGPTNVQPCSQADCTPQQTTKTV